MIRTKKITASALVLACTLIASVPVSGQDDEQLHEDIYEPFNPDAERLSFEAPEFAKIQVLDPRTQSVFTLDVDPRRLGPEHGLEIYVFEVGQADSMLIVGPAPAYRTLLVDLGTSRHGRFTGRYSAEHVGQRIVDITGRAHVDYFLLSHMHTDHFGSGNSGITALLSHSDFTVGTIIDTGGDGEDRVGRSQSARDYIERTGDWIEAGIVESRVEPEFGTGQIDLGGDVIVDIVAFAGRTSQDGPTVHDLYEQDHRRHYSRNPTSENDLSIALEISLGEFEFWTAGDLSGADGQGTNELSGSGNGYTNVEFPLVQAWAAAGRESDVEVYRASHHGSRYSSGGVFLDALDPEVILISAEYGHWHPSRGMVSRGEETAEMFATDVDPRTWTNESFSEAGGTVTGEIRVFVSTDGGSYTVGSETYQSFTDAEEAAGQDE